MALTGRRILVTGADGFVGRHLLKSLHQVHDPARILALCGPNSACGGDGIDLRDRAAIVPHMARFRPECIVHLGALSSSAERADPMRVWEVNFTGTRNLAEAIREYVPHAHVIFASSAEVYGESFADGPCAEEAQLRPRTPYARSKAAAEMLLREDMPAATPVTVLRLFNHSGPGQDERFVIPAFAAQIARAEKGQASPALRTGNLHAMRDMTAVADIVEAYLAVIAGPHAQGHRVFNVGSGRLTSIADIAARLIGMARIPIALMQDPDRMRISDVISAAGDVSLFHRTFRWSARVDMDAMLRETLEFWRCQMLQT